VGRPALSARLQDVQEASDVRFNIGVGMREAMTHARLCGEVDHTVELVFTERALYGFLINEIGANEIPQFFRSASGLRQQFELPLLQFRAENRVPALKNAFCRMEADKARRTRDEDFQIKGVRRSPVSRTPP
jgi:hypothetical protein